MAFADYAAYLSALRSNIAADFQMSATTGAAARFADCSRVFLPAPATPTTSVALSRTSDRATNGLVPNAGAGRLSILGARLNPAGAAGNAIMLVDMLNISGGMSGTTTGNQSTNLPTAALTRYTSGEGVCAAIIVHSQIGTTGTTVTASYTNQGGTGSRTSPAVVIGGTGFREAGILIRLPLQAGDTGIRSVESINIVATTGTAGNIGIVLFKPLALIFVNDVEGANVIDCISSGCMVGQFNEVLDDACLSVLVTSNVAQAVSGNILLGEA